MKMNGGKDKKEVEKIYFGLYKDMIRLFKHKSTTTNSELDKIGKSLFSNKYLGTFPQDKLPNEIYNKPSRFAIINTDLQGSKGEHWVAVAGLPNSNKVMVFDSFGRKSKILLPTLLQKNIIDTDYDKEQQIYQLSCGQYSMAFLLFFHIYGSGCAKFI